MSGNFAHRLPLLDCIIYPVDVICSVVGSECWRFSKKIKSNKQNKVKPTMNVFKQNTVSEHPLQRSLTGFPKLSQKKQKTAKNYNNTSDGVQEL